MTSKLTIFITAVLLLSSCDLSRSKNTYKTTIYTEKGCDKIFAELAYARRYKQSLHKNDKFMLRYMLVIPALVETYKIIRNENKVNKRIANLQYQAQSSNCYENNANARSSFSPYSQDAPSSNSSSSGSSQYSSSSSSGSSSSSSSILSGISNLFK
jgi:hypothetical protein